MEPNRSIPILAHNIVMSEVDAELFASCRHKVRLYIRRAIVAIGINVFWGVWSEVGVTELHRHYHCALEPDFAAAVATIRLDCL